MDGFSAFSHDDISDIMSRTEDISTKLEEEDSKPDEDYDREKAVKLAYEQMLQGMKIFPTHLFRLKMFYHC